VHMRSLLLLLGGASGFGAGAGAGGRRSVLAQLAPRDVLVAEFEVASRGGRITLDSAASSVALIADLIAEGDISIDEVGALWSAAVGVDDANTLDVNGFVEVCTEIDGLFEDDEDEVEEAEEEAPEEDAEEGSVEALRARLVKLLPGRDLCQLHDAEDEEADEDLVQACEALVEACPIPDARTVNQLLCGCEWELAFTSSPSFSFNGGFSGVGRTTPGGGNFKSLSQKLKANGITTLQEELALKVGGTRLLVDVDGDWGLVKRIDVISYVERTHLECTPRRVKYGVVNVEGNRVVKGWKTMRVLNGLALSYIDPNIRVHRGNTKRAWFVWRRKVPPPKALPPPRY